MEGQGGGFREERNASREDRGNSRFGSKPKPRFGGGGGGGGFGGDRNRDRDRGGDRRAEKSRRW
jgi:hypothetical protein